MLRQAFKQTMQSRVAAADVDKDKAALLKTALTVLVPSRGGSLNSSDFSYVEALAAALALSLAGAAAFRLARSRRLPLS